MRDLLVQFESYINTEFFQKYGWIQSYQELLSTAYASIFIYLLLFALLIIYIVLRKKGKHPSETFIIVVLFFLSFTFALEGSEGDYSLSVFESRVQAVGTFAAASGMLLLKIKRSVARLFL